MADPRSLGPIQFRIARALAKRHDRGDATLWYWESAENIARATRVPLRRVKHHLHAFVRAGLIDRHDDDGWIVYRMRGEFAEKLYSDPSRT